MDAAHLNTANLVSSLIQYDFYSKHSESPCTFRAIDYNSWSILSVDSTTQYSQMNAYISRDQRHDE